MHHKKIRKGREKRNTILRRTRTYKNPESGTSVSYEENKNEFGLGLASNVEIRTRIIRKPTAD